MNEWEARRYALSLRLLCQLLREQIESRPRSVKCHRPPLPPLYKPPHRFRGVRFSCAISKVELADSYFVERSSSIEIHTFPSHLSFVDIHLSKSKVFYTWTYATFFFLSTIESVPIRKAFESKSFDQSWRVALELLLGDFCDFFCGGVKGACLLMTMMTDDLRNRRERTIQWCLDW